MTFYDLLRILRGMAESPRDAEVILKTVEHTSWWLNDRQCTPEGEDLLQLIDEWKNLTWYCHICGKECPNHCIEVFHIDLSAEYEFPRGTIFQNVRYCRDRSECRDKAPRKRFLPSPTENQP